MEPSAAIDAIRREVQDTTHDGVPARTIVAERTYQAPASEVWDALTNPDRLPRWFLPISGDLQLGGRYQFEGNAGGSITSCDPPRYLAVTWEFEGAVTWVDVHLTENGDETTLRLEHVAPVDDTDRWDEFGPGAVGVGWDLSLLGLADHLVTGGDVSPDPSDPAGVEFMRRSSEAWGEAAIAYGTPFEKAVAAASRTTLAYTDG